MAYNLAIKAYGATTELIVDNLTIGAITNVIAEEISTDFLKVNWTYEMQDGETDGETTFEIWYNDIAITIPDWTPGPNVISVGTAGNGDSGNPLRTFEALINLTTGAVTWWETFETYEVGEVTDMNEGGSIWNGGWSDRASSYSTENFESYADGSHATLGGGSGWNGDWA